MLYVGSLGLIFSNAMASALEYFKNNSAVATAVIGVTQFLFAGFFAFIASIIHTGELLPIFILMSVTSFFALVSILFLKP